MIKLKFSRKTINGGIALQNSDHRKAGRGQVQVRKKVEDPLRLVRLGLRLHRTWLLPTDGKVSDRVVVSFNVHHRSSSILRQ